MWAYLDGAYSTNCGNQTVDIVQEFFSSQFVIGDYEAGDFTFNGSIDNVMVWDRTLSDQEIKELNNTFNIGKYTKEGDFKSLVFFNETSTYWNVTFSQADTFCKVLDR